jgi:cephalosporin-C deacetylase-like acetyl esterase
VPWLCDWPDYAVTAPWAPENYPKLLAERKELSLEQLHTILGYVDVMNLAPRIHCPVTVSMGLVDDTCPPRTIMAVYNRITAPKSIRYYPHGDHGGGGAADKTIRNQWLAAMLQAGNP